MITAPVSLSCSPATSKKCSIALPIQAKTSETPSFLSAIKPSSDAERPNRTFPMVFSNLCGCSSIQRLLRHRFQQFREALVGIIDSFFHPTLERAIAVGDRLENRLSSEPGSSAGHCFEGECFQTHVSCFREPFKLKGVNNALGREHFMVHATKGELVATLILADVAPSATAPGLKRLECHGEPSWSKPLDVQLWIGEGLKHQLARRVEFARDEHFLLPWFCRNGCFVGVCHWFFLSFLSTARAGLSCSSRASFCFSRSSTVSSAEKRSSHLCLVC